MQSIKEKEKNACGVMKERFGYTNVMAARHIEKVVVSTGTGKRSHNNRTFNEFVGDRLTKITGQKVALRPARKSMAAYKIREGDPIGQVVTLRGRRMYDFLDRLINIAIPRMRDFRGFDRKSVDEMGNLTIGIREHNIFPETADEELKDIFGLAVTIVTDAINRDEATVFFEEIGMPFKKK